MLTIREEDLIRKQLREHIKKLLPEKYTDRNGRPIIEIERDFNVFSEFINSPDGNTVLIDPIIISGYFKVNDKRIGGQTIWIRVENENPVSFNFNKESNIVEFGDIGFKIVDEQ